MTTEITSALTEDPCTKCGCTNWITRVTIGDEKLCRQCYLTEFAREEKPPAKKKGKRK